MKFVVALALCATALAHAQAPIERRDPNIPVLKVESRLVPVALNVTDAHGAPVGGLTVDDFEVLEDGKPVKIAVFEKESVTPLSVVMTVDASETTLQDVKLVREAGRKFAKSILREKDEVALLAFSDQVTEVVPFTKDASRVDAGLGAMPRGAATAMYDAIYLSADKLAETSAANGRRRVIVIISDGENTTHHGSYDMALERAQRAGAMLYALIDVPVEADAGRSTGGEHALIQMCEDTGGKYYYVKDRRDLTPAFEHISDDLRTQYTVGYYAPQKGGDRNGFRRIEIRMKDKSLGYVLRYRLGYYGVQR